MEVWAARVPLKAHPDRQRLLSQENSSQTALRFSARSQFEPFVAGLASPLSVVAAALAAPLGGVRAHLEHTTPKRPTPHGGAYLFFLCRRASPPFVRGVAAQPPFHHEFASRFLLCRWVSRCLARNHNSMHRQSRAE